MKRIIQASLIFVTCLFISLNAIEKYSSNKSYPAGSQVEYNGKIYQTKWWAEPTQKPGQKVEHEWDTPWQLVTGVQQAKSPEPKKTEPKTEKKDQQAPDPVKNKPVDKTVFKQASGWPKRVFAPFVDATLYPVAKIGQIAQETGIRYFVLGFIVSKDNKPSWGGYYSLDQGPESWAGGSQYFLYDELKKLRDLGGDFMISLGGANGTPLAATAKSVEELVNYYKNIIAQFKLTHIDFDIEGQWVSDQASIERRNKALAVLQKDLSAKKQPLNIWFTLPVLPNGLTQEGISVIENALKNGVKLSGINIMAMDYGDSAAPNPEGNMGSYAIKAATSLKSQLQEIYKKFGQNITDSQAWSMVGITPMIGLNDVVSERFTLADAKQLQEFAAKNNIALLSMWSINRDKPCPGEKQVQTNCSSTADQTKPYEFSQIFNKFTQAT